MTTQIVPDQALIANLPPTLQQAIAAAQVLLPQVNGRYTAAVQLVATGGAVLNADGSVCVISRSGGPRHHLNGNGCDCPDARHNAPAIAGKRACAHQVAAWILHKAARLAVETQPTGVAPDPQPLTPDTVPSHLTQAQLTVAAGRLAGVAYEVVVTHIGGHGDVSLLRAVDDEPGHPSYLVCGSWHDDELYVARWGRRWGQVDVAAMQQLAGALARPEPPTQADQGRDRGPLAPALAYYLETSAHGVKVMVTHGEAYPRPVKQFSGTGHLEEAREFAATRAEAQRRGMQQATPGARIEVRHGLLPESWRQRMGGFQVGRAWVVYVGTVAQPVEVAA